MDALKEIRRYLETEGSLSARQLSLKVADSHAYIHSVMKGRHCGSYEAGEKLGTILFPDDPDRQQKFVLSFMAGREVAA